MLQKISLSIIWWFLLYVLVVLPCAWSLLWIPPYFWCEGRKDPFSSLYKYKPTAPDELFYDFECQLNEYCLNRTPHFFRCTHFGMIYFIELHVISLIRMFMHHLEFTNLDPFVFSNIKIPLCENTPNLYISLLAVRIPISIIC